MQAHCADVLADRAGAQDRLRVSAVGHVGQGPRQQRRQEHVRDRAHLRGYHARDGQHCPGPCIYCRYCRYISRELNNISTSVNTQWKSIDAESTSFSTVCKTDGMRFNIQG